MFALKRKREPSFQDESPKPETEHKKKKEKFKGFSLKKINAVPDEKPLVFYRKLKIFGLLFMVVGFGAMFGYIVSQYHFGTPVFDKKNKVLREMAAKQKELEKSYNTFRLQDFDRLTKTKADDKNIGEWANEAKSMLCGDYINSIQEINNEMISKNMGNPEGDPEAKQQQIDFGIKGMLRSGDDKVLLIVRNNGKEESWKIARKGSRWVGLNIPDPYRLDNIDFKNNEVHLSRSDFPDVDIAAKISGEEPVTSEPDIKTLVTEQDTAGDSYIVVSNGKTKKAIIGNGNDQPQRRAPGNPNEAGNVTIK